MRITPTTLSVNQLFGATNEQYVIPAYQRRYSWRDSEVWDLVDDIGLMEEGESHLLGSIVCLIQDHTAGINKLELVDGQQRLTTICILMECICEQLEKHNLKDEVSEIRRLLTSKSYEGRGLKKVALDSMDSEEYSRLLSNKDNGQFNNFFLKAAFDNLRQWVQGQSKESLTKFLYRLRNHAIIIRLDVSNAKDAFKLFETINNRGLKLSPTDIIKNFFLGNAARFGNDALQSARSTWARILIDLDGISTDMFFRYYLAARLKTRVTTSYVAYEFEKLFMNEVTEAQSLPERHQFSESEADKGHENNPVEDDTKHLGNKKRKARKRISFTDFLLQLEKYAELYGKLVSASIGNASIDSHLRNLQMIDATQAYGFLMNLRFIGCNDKMFVTVLKLTENFLMRRHICQERANETETLFARLCGLDLEDPIKRLKKEYEELCPSDEKFKSAFTMAQFTSSLIDRARYCLERIEISRHGEHEELDVSGPDKVHVEHIIPKKIRTQKAKREFGDWIKYLGDNSEELHEKYVSRIGNLTLFAGELNISASNNPFRMKKKAYRKSGIRMTRELADLPRFKFKNVEERSRQFAEFAVELWPSFEV